MKAKDVIAQLQQFDPEAEVHVAVYGCSGFDDCFPIDDAEQREYHDGSKWIQLDISVGCKVHRSAAFKVKCGAV